MDKNDFINVAIADLGGQEKPVKSVRESVAPVKADAFVEMAINDLTGGQPVEVKVPTEPRAKLDLAEAFNRSLDNRVEESDVKTEETKTTLAKEIFESGQDVLSKMLKGLH
jgi:hypothetical protein